MCAKSFKAKNVGYQCNLYAEWNRCVLNVCLNNCSVRFVSITWFVSIAFAISCWTGINAFSFNGLYADCSFSWSLFDVKCSDSYLLHHLCSKWEVGYRHVVGKDIDLQTMLIFRIGVTRAFFSGTGSMPLSNDVLISLVSAGICADDVFFIISVGRGSKEHVVDSLDMIIFPCIFISK